MPFDAHHVTPCYIISQYGRATVYNGVNRNITLVFQYVGQPNFMFLGFKNSAKWPQINANIRWPTTGECHVTLRVSNRGPWAELR